MPHAFAHQKELPIPLSPPPPCPRRHWSCPRDHRFCINRKSKLLPIARPASQFSLPPRTRRGIIFSIRLSRLSAAWTRSKGRLPSVARTQSVLEVAFRATAANEEITASLPMTRRAREAEGIKLSRNVAVLRVTEWTIVFSLPAYPRFKKGRMLISHQLHEDLFFQWPNGRRNLIMSDSISLHHGKLSR